MNWWKLGGRIIDVIACLVALGSLAIGVAARFDPVFFEFVFGPKREGGFFDQADIAILFAAFIFFKFAIECVAEMFVRKGWLGPTAVALAVLGIALWIYGTHTDDSDFHMYAELCWLAASGILVLMFIVVPLVGKVFSYLPGR